MLSNLDAHDHGAHDLLSIAHMPFAGLVRGGFLASRKDRTSNSLSEPRMPFLMARRLSAEDSKRKPPRQPNLFSSVGHRHPPIDTVSSTFQTSICLLLLPFAKVGDLPHSGYYGNSVLSPEQKVRRGLSVPEDSSQAQRSVDLRPTTGNRPPECPFHPLPPRASPRSSTPPFPGQLILKNYLRIVPNITILVIPFRGSLSLSSDWTARKERDRWFRSVSTLAVVGKQDECGPNMCLCIQ
jgi:hypothetical protein